MKYPYLKRHSHWSITYFYNRINVLVYQKMHPDHPWLTKDAITFLSSWLKPTDVVLERGSGRSTPWLASRVLTLISVEHDVKWHDRTRNILEKHCISSVKLFIKSTSTGEYVQLVDDIVLNSLDFCLVDGKLRAECALAVLNKLKPGAFLIIDNINRYLPSDSRSPGSLKIHDDPVSENWSLFASLVKSWRCIWTTNGVWDTAIWIVPNHSCG